MASKGIAPTATAMAALGHRISIRQVLPDRLRALRTRSCQEE